MLLLFFFFHHSVFLFSPRPPLQNLPLSCSSFFPERKTTLVQNPTKLLISSRSLLGLHPLLFVSETRNPPRRLKTSWYALDTNARALLNPSFVLLSFQQSVVLYRASLRFERSASSSLRNIRRAKRVLLSSKTTTRNKSSYLSPYAHRPDHSLTLSLSKMTKESPWCFPFQNGQC